MNIYILVLSVLMSVTAFATDMTVVGFSSEYNAVAFCKTLPMGLSGFKKGETGLSLIPAKFEQRNSTDDTQALDLESAEEKPKTCWFLVTPLDFPILVKGIALQGAAVVLKDFLGVIKPKESKTVVIGPDKYSLSFPKVASEKFHCALGEEVVDLDGGGFEIMLAADLNADGLPDFIVQNARKYTFKQYQILMSDKKEKKCRVIASKEVYNC